MPFTPTGPRCTGTTSTGLPCGRPAGHPNNGPSNGHRPVRTTRTTSNVPTASVDVVTVDALDASDTFHTSDVLAVRIGNAWVRPGAITTGTVGDHHVVIVTDTRGMAHVITDSVDMAMVASFVPNYDVSHVDPAGDYVDPDDVPDVDRDGVSRDYDADAS